MQVNIKGFEFSIEDKIAMKLDLFCDRVTKKHPALDACITNSGGEGEGKTGASLVEAVYAHLRTGRPINLFFKTSTCQAHLQKTEKQIAILDEPSLESLSTDVMTTRSRDFLRLTSTMRSKRHFLIVNVTKFWKFPEFLIVDRALGMIHLHSKNGTDMGRFLYIRKKNLEKLWNGYKKNGLRLYGKLKSFGGRFPYVMEDLFKLVPINIEGHPNCSFEDYQRLKDEAIASIGEVKSKKITQLESDLIILRAKIGNLNPKDLKNKTDLSNQLGIPRTTLNTWARKAENMGLTKNSLRKRGFDGFPEDKLFNNVANEQENFPASQEDEEPEQKNNDIADEDDDFEDD